MSQKPLNAANKVDSYVGGRTGLVGKGGRLLWVRAQPDGELRSA